MERGYYHLDYYKKIKIKDDYYNILGYAEFKEGEEFWKKFRLMGSDGFTYWLHVYEEFDKELCKMYYELLPLPGEPLETIYEEQNFVKTEEGIATCIKIKGINDLKVLDEVTYKDYENADNFGELLSYEKWNQNLNFEYGKGKYIYKQDITFIKGKNYVKDFVEMTNSIDLFFEISLGKTILIEREEFVVQKINTFETKTREWSEYQLTSPLRNKWLYMERQDDKYLTIFGNMTQFPIEYLGMSEVLFGGQVFEYMESEPGKFKTSTGRLDLEKKTMRIYIYQTFMGDESMIIRQWKNGRVAYKGRYISVRDIIISDKAEKKIRLEINKPFVVLVIIFFILLGIYTYDFGIQRASMVRKIEDSTEFVSENIASYTGSIEDEKEGVFRTEETFETAKEYIKTLFGKKLLSEETVNENIEKTYIATTKREVAVVYTSTEGIVYVYISNIEIARNANLNIYKASDPQLITKVKNAIGK